MDPPNGKEGPDGSSIKPVSSLLARFENLSATQSPEQPPARSVSPAPKPSRLRNFKSDTSPIPAKSPGKPSPSIPDEARSLPPSEADASMPPPVPPNKPVPAAKPLGLAISTPAVTVQPPQSPPKTRELPPEAGSHSPFLDPTPATSHEGLVGPSNPTKLPNRPLTSLLPHAAPKSPRVGTANPPSPPPPRRSAEVRRERNVKQAPQPPAPRTTKTSTSRPPPVNLADPRSGSALVRAATTISQGTSPFTSPPTSPGEVVGEAPPPDLPTRPRPRRLSDASSKPGSGRDGLGALQKHRSIPARRLEQSQSSNNPERPGMASPRAGDHRFVHQHDASSLDIGQPNISAANAAAEATPRAPRSIAQITTPKSDAHAFPRPSSRSASQSAPRRFAAPPPPSQDNGVSGKPASDRGRSELRRSSTFTPIKSASSTLVSSGPTMGSTPSGVVTAYPDGASANRRPPAVKRGCHEIQTRFDPRVLDVCGELACTSGQLTRVWNLLDGELVMSLPHSEGVRATVAAFKPAPSADTEGSFLWVGTNLGELMEIEVSTQRILHHRAGIHGRCDVVRIHRHVDELWTFDETGTFHLWGPGTDAVPSLHGHPHQTNKLPRGHTFSMVIGDELWHAAGKSIRVFAPSLDGSRLFQVLVRPLAADGAGEVTAGTQAKTHQGKVFFGHIDGKISIFSTSDYSCVAVLSISSWKINALAGVGPHMWAAYNTGKMCVYDMTNSPWIVKKDWQAHEQAVIKMKADPASSYRLDRLQVVTLGGDNKIKAWDGLLQDDWLEEDMKSKDVDYCDFQDIHALVMTWNAGVSTPTGLRYSHGDATFFQELVQSSGSPEILIFGFQELVDLEDKTATAKRFLKSSKKKEGADQERMSHQYRDWRDFLMKTLDDYMPSGHLYHLLHSAPLVGLFTCVFVKSCLRERISNLSAAEVKRGMGGLHGNKGAVVVRFQVDDTSLCFINCHLAAGQSQSSSRHNDVAAILDASLFPAERDIATQIDRYTGGGDGTMILDHELCVLNGDLNYRIDTMSRDTVVKAVQQQNLAKLLDRDQLLIARRRNPAFRLRAFEELPITFPPTYKYDVGTDNYDTSEKKRSPAWCDRLLFRGRGRVQQLDYRRHEVRVSDHRPVTGTFRLWVKRAKPRERAFAWMQSQQEFEDLRQQEIADEQVLYLVQTCGYDQESSRNFVQERIGRKTDRSRSRSAANP